MKVEMFTPRFAGCKSFYAQLDQGEKITIVEPFCVLNSGPLPVIVGMCTLAATMRFDRAEAGAKQISISLRDENGRTFMPDLETTLEVKVPDNASTVTVPLAFLLKQISLPALGEYLIELGVDGKSEASTVLHVRRQT